MLLVLNRGRSKTHAKDSLITLTFVRKTVSFGLFVMCLCAFLCNAEHLPFITGRWNIEDLSPLPSINTVARTLAGWTILFRWCHWRQFAKWQPVSGALASPRKRSAVGHDSPYLLVSIERMFQGQIQLRPSCVPLLPVWVFSRYSDFLPHSEKTWALSWLETFDCSYVWVSEWSGVYMQRLLE